MIQRLADGLGIIAAEFPDASVDGYNNHVSVYAEHDGRSFSTTLPEGWTYRVTEYPRAKLHEWSFGT